MSQPEVERRAFSAEMRASETGPPKIEGYAALFNVKSQDLMFFREIIMPGAFDRALREGQDVRALWNHNSDMVLGRTTSGTLRLSVDAKGLKIENDLPDTQAGRDAYTLIKRGDVNQMSFAFRTIGDNWRTEEGENIRELTDLELLDVSPVAYPAYTETQVAARAIEHAKELRAVPPNVSTKLADRGTAWARPTLEDFTSETWDNLDASERRRIAGHFAYSTEMPPDAYGSLKLPHHRPSDGAVVWAGVTAAAQRMGQASMAPGDMAAVKAHLAAHYHQFGERAPWEGDGGMMDDEGQNSISLETFQARQRQAEAE